MSSVNLSVYSSVIKVILRLIHSPHEEWEAIVERSKDTDDVRRDFFFPCLTIVIVVSILSSIIHYHWSEMIYFTQFMQFMGRNLLILFATLFFGVITTSFCLSWVVKRRRFDVEEEAFPRCFTLAVYASSIMWMLMLVENLIPSLFFLPVLNLYVVYVVWVGLPILFPSISMDEVKQYWMTLIAILLLILIPMGVNKVIKFLIS